MTGGSIQSRPAPPMSLDVFQNPGRFFRGNLHTHSNRSDGMLAPEAVAAHYREAGYDFLALTDHFLPRYDFPIVDTRPFRTNRFTTILGAEVHAPANSHGEVWHILSVGLPEDFPPTGEGRDRRRACAARGRGRRVRGDRASAMVEPHDRGRPRAADGACGRGLQSTAAQLESGRGDGATLLDRS